jgi:hypothetical protein
LRCRGQRTVLEIGASGSDLHAADSTGPGRGQEWDREQSDFDTTTNKITEYIMCKDYYLTLSHTVITYSAPDMLRYQGRAGYTHQASANAKEL